jgi:hypothetical protein
MGYNGIDNKNDNCFEAKMKLIKKVDQVEYDPWLRPYGQIMVDACLLVKINA